MYAYFKDSRPRVRLFSICQSARLSVRLPVCLFRCLWIYMCMSVLIRIRIQLLLYTVTDLAFGSRSGSCSSSKWWESANTGLHYRPGLDFEPPGLHCERARPSIDLSWISNLMRIRIQLFYNADPDPASKNNAYRNHNPGISGVFVRMSVSHVSQGITTNI